MVQKMHLKGFLQLKWARRLLCFPSPLATSLALPKRAPPSSIFVFLSKSSPAPLLLSLARMAPSLAAWRLCSSPSARLMQLVPCMEGGPPQTSRVLPALPEYSLPMLYKKTFKKNYKFLALLRGSTYILSYIIIFISLKEKKISNYIISYIFHFLENI